MRKPSAADLIFMLRLNVPLHGAQLRRLNCRVVTASRLSQWASTHPSFQISSPKRPYGFCSPTGGMLWLNVQRVVDHLVPDV